LQADAHSTRLLPSHHHRYDDTHPIRKPRLFLKPVSGVTCGVRLVQGWRTVGRHHSERCAQSKREVGYLERVSDSVREQRAAQGSRCRRCYLPSCLCGVDSVLQHLLSRLLHGADARPLAHRCNHAASSQASQCHSGTERRSMIMCATREGR